jgi:hypothetical protein
MDQEITAFYSRDGSLWTQAAAPPEVLSSLKAQALYGIAVTSHSHGDTTVGVFDQVSAQPGQVSVTGLTASGGDRRVLLEWLPLRDSRGYNIYRGPAGASREQLVPLNSSPVREASFLDQGASLANGTPMTYAVAPLLSGAGGSSVEGPAVAVQATPVVTPPGWLASHVGGRPLAGGGSYDASGGVLTLRGSGAGTQARSDEFYFLGQPVEGNVQITVRMRSQPATGSAGLMIREGLDMGARRAFLGVNAGLSLLFGTRLAPGGPAGALPAIPAAGGGVRLPILLRLTRQGTEIRFEYAPEAGKPFELAVPPISINPPLSRRLHVGLAIASGDPGRISEARFDLLKIDPLP